MTYMLLIPLLKRLPLGVYTEPLTTLDVPLAFPVHNATEFLSTTTTHQNLHCQFAKLSKLWLDLLAIEYVWPTRSVLANSLSKPRSPTVKKLLKSPFELIGKSHRRKCPPYSEGRGSGQIRAEGIWPSPFVFDLSIQREIAS